MFDPKGDLCVTGLALPQAFLPIKELNSETLSGLDNDLAEEVSSDLQWLDEDVQDAVAQLKSNDASW